jgi:hypothetical protein
MSNGNLFIELAVLAVCIYCGYGFGKPATDPAHEKLLRGKRRIYLWLWGALVFSGILIAFSVADYTMLFIGAGFAIGFAARRATS